MLAADCIYPQVVRANPRLLNFVWLLFHQVRHSQSCVIFSRVLEPELGAGVPDEAIFFGANSHLNLGGAEAGATLLKDSFQLQIFLVAFRFTECKVIKWPSKKFKKSFC